MQIYNKQKQIIALKKNYHQSVKSQLEFYFKVVISKTFPDAQ